MKGKSKALFALVAVVMTMGAIWHTSRVIPPKEATWEDVRAEASQGGYQLISTEDLFRQYTAKPQSLLVVDTRQEWEYRTGHIKGAVNFPMQPTWLSRWRNKGALEKLLGPDKDRFIVFY
ncbi:MAG: rhodanese-like domain-containing protein [Desulfobacterales bacterium]|jgi:3-mercaptopyruvate sulfurtransferase SseA